MSTLPITDKVYFSEDFITWTFQQFNSVTMEGPISSTSVLDFVNTQTANDEFGWVKTERFFGATALKSDGKAVVNFLHFPMNISKNSKCKFRIILDVGTKINIGWFSKVSNGAEFTDLKTFEIRRNSFYEISELNVQTLIDSGFIDLEITQNKNEIIISINGYEKLISSFNLEDLAIPEINEISNYTRALGFGVKCLTGKVVIDLIEFGTVTGDNDIFKGANFTSQMNGAKFVIPDYDSVVEQIESNFFEINDTDILSVPISIPDDYTTGPTSSDPLKYKHFVSDLHLRVLGDTNNRKKFKIWFSETPSTSRDLEFFESQQIVHSTAQDDVYERIDSYYQINLEKTIFVNAQFQSDLTNPGPALRIKFDNLYFHWSKTEIA